MSGSGEKIYVYTGGYTQDILLGNGEIVAGKCCGIGVYALENDGLLRQIQCVPSNINPSYIAVSADGSFLYTANEMQSFHGMPSSLVSAYRINRETGTLEFINAQLSGGVDACHVALTCNGKWLMAANYSGGSICLMPVLADGSLGNMVCLYTHPGRGSHPQRQLSAHPHQVVFSPDERFVFIVDLGLDKLVCYEANWNEGSLLRRSEKDICLMPGDGPRHCCFNDTGDKLYVITELSCRIHVFDYDIRQARAERVQTLELEPKGSAAEIQFCAARRQVVCSVRGCENIYVLDVQEDGRLMMRYCRSCGGKTPRDFAITADGSYLLVGCQDTDELIVWKMENCELIHCCSVASPSITTVSLMNSAQ